jgi:hypothetical protein
LAAKIYKAIMVSVKLKARDYNYHGHEIPENDAQTISEAQYC